MELAKVEEIQDCVDVRGKCGVVKHFDGRKFQQTTWSHDSHGEKLPSQMVV